NWETVSNWFSGFGRWFGGFWEDLLSKFDGGVGQMWRTITLFIQNPILGLIRAFGQLLNAGLTFGEWIAPYIGKGLQLAWKAVQDYYKFWWNFWTSTFPNAAITGLKAWGQGVWNYFTWFWGTAVPGFFNNVGNWFHNAGKNLMITFANGIRSQVHDALAPIIEFTNRVRAYLPSSDAKVGALSDLTASGKALLMTVAEGVDPTALINAVTHGMEVTRQALQFNPLPANNTNNYNTSQPVVLNFNPTINADGNTDGRDIIDQLRPFARELIDMLTRNNNRITRSVF
ncbi:MAG: hypothetical protein AAFX46_13315, partial [Cyanobacteria bacterium J06636_27]